MPESRQESEVKLKRSLGPLLVTFYGLGTIIGAGIYVLLGAVAGLAGNWLPASFILAGSIASLTALSYAELSTRLPYCAGAAIYIEQAWRQLWMATLVGWLLVLTGIVSAAAIANGFVGYLNVFLETDASVAITLLLLGIGLLAAWDIQASAMAIFIVTLIEVGGLILVTAYAFTVDVDPAPTVALQANLDSTALSGIILGSFVAFYAFIGFEDMVNIVEEVRNPRRNMPLGIILSVILALVLYCAIAIAALRVLPATELANSEAPLSDVMAASGGNAYLISLISLIAVINGALVQIIMASRVLYGMAGKKMAPAFIGKITPSTHTPVLATALIVIAVLIFALALPLTQLAQLTSLIMLVIFTLVNLALLSIKNQPGVGGQAHILKLPRAIPLLGAITAAMLLAYQLISFI